MTMTICPACDRPAHTEDITDGFCPDCRDNAAAHELRAEVRRLRTRETALTKLLYQEERKVARLRRVFTPVIRSIRDAKVWWISMTERQRQEALKTWEATMPLVMAADLSAPATEGTP